ncbi:hypothetical protein DXX93_08605 [Thalassotalea euphylliae]|uniref:ImpA N-terminal domain-containing protein n=1 Tax=Thalassotalea euphylliae TaxID=1655234 RepID=A0A3E0TPT0_9GAMM|nr:TssA family type VI secretion system protein [Thalassotalea euphylliae]REL26631.1 hypothetical protein DXX93_08605 [Thalassotalea euphylliae]
MTHYTHDNWSVWLEHLVSPLAGEACGEDLKYEEDFKYLKSAFSTIAEIDCKKVFITGTHLLAEKSKDLRIASYVMCAAAQEYSVEGLAYGLKLVNQLTADFSEKLHPLRPKARAAVHTWLLSQQQRMIAFAEMNSLEQPSQIVSLLEELNQYGSTTARVLDENAGTLSDLKQWAEKLSKKYPIVDKPVATQSTQELIAELADEQVSTQTDSQPIATLANQANQANKVNTPLAQQTVVVEKPISVESDSEYLALARKLLAFDKETNNINRMISLARAVRWSTLKIPPNENGKTRLPAPRQTAFAPIKNALVNEDYEDALFAAESLFLEGAMHFNFDLQGMALSALKGMNQTRVVNNLAMLVHQLNQEFPKLAGLSYEDGSPFCSAKTKELLSEIAEQFSASENTGDDDNTYNTLELKAKELLAQGKLDKALSLANELPANNQFAQAKQQLLKVKLCLSAEKYEFAEPMLRALISKIEQGEIGQWQPSFSMQVWRSAVTCFETLSTEEGDEYWTLSKQLKNKMILTQPEVALGWI